MDDWLKKLLSGLAAPQGSNPFKAPAEGQRNPDYLGTPPLVYNPDHPYYKKQTTGPQYDEPQPVGTPLHTSVPDPNKGAFMQVRDGIGAIPTDNPSNEVSKSPPNTVTGNMAVAPLSPDVVGNSIDPNSFEGQLAKARGAYNTAVTDPAKKQNPWLQAIFQGLQATQRIADPHNPANAQPVQWLGDAKKADRVRKAGETLAPLEAQNERIIGEKYKKAQIDNYYEDNAERRAAREDRSKRAADELIEKKWMNFHKRNPSFSVKNATPSQIKDLAAIGKTPEDVGDYDLTKRDFKTIGGVTYKWDNNEKAFVDTNAMKDPSKSFKTVKLKDPETKEVHTLVVTEEDYAKMLNSRTVAGMQIEAAETRQKNAQQFTDDQGAKNHQRQLQRDGLRVQMEMAYKAHEDAVKIRDQKAAELAKMKLIDFQKQYDAIPDDDQ